MDVISKIVLGQEAGCLQKSDFRSELSDHLQAAFATGWIGPSFPTLSMLALWVSERVPFHLFPLPHLQYKQFCEGMIKAYLNKFEDSDAPHLVEGKSQETLTPDLLPLSESRSAVIEMLRDSSSTKDCGLLSLEQLIDEVGILLTAGSDTTSQAIISGIWFISQHEHVQEKLVSELCTESPSLEEDITFEKAKSLPYLTAVIRETLRLAHPLPGRLPRVVPKKGFQLHGHQVPGGVNIHVSAYILNRHPEVWDEPNQFNPSRWLRDDASFLDSQSATFGRGARQCLGKDLAWCELWLLFANLFRRYKVTITSGPKHAMAWSDIVILHYDSKLYATFEKRAA
ncbi:hypothetical protein G7054_g2973 [Neopestalotiopsis clavispora]|nr:hypothetical protein G7054_g2973 [Neopestalotiopsis clavispora]